MSHDKQLRGISLRASLRKQKLDQALNAKEFAVLAGVSYATAREWLHLPGFPALRGLVFWRDFVFWRRVQTGLETMAPTSSGSSRPPTTHRRNRPTVSSNEHWPEERSRFPNGKAKR